ncbi:Slp family lipoprotein, partial [Beggiatoa alba]|nr:Slp family lipoprotein [Beggiatoa alba]
PIRETQSYGRFILSKQGYLELGEYAKDRWITVVGQLVAKHEGKVGETQYQYPVLDAQQIKIWPDEPRYYDDSDVRFHFGIGVYHHY